MLARTAEIGQKRPFDTVSKSPSKAGYMSLSKQELRALADQLLTCEPGAVRHCVDFVGTDSKGLWHGRARAMMSRRLKHCPLEIRDQTKLVAVILKRLKTGDFSEQFKDQLRLALHLNASVTLSACRLASSSQQGHVRRYATWLLSTHGEKD